MSDDARPLLGHIPYLNSRPIHAGLVATGAIDEIELVTGTPAELARQLRAGELDIAPLSLIEYLRHADRYVLLPNLAIGAPGAVRSVRLVGRTAPGDLRGRIVMTDASATSHVLLSILLKELWRADAECVAGPVVFPGVLREAEAALLIGDDALRLDATPLDGLHVTDLGAAWRELTGVPMVFAVWAARREFVQARPDAAARVAAGLNASLAWSLSRLTEVAASAPPAGLPDAPDYLTTYFEGLDYGLGEAALAGLAAFAGRAHAHGLLASVPEFEFMPEALPEAA